ncbi:MAG: 30S ribosomal protein S12 methylthiotransferase RimO [Syntrophomonadaceae bacterium]|nr:30S ribosomal protein S12 methylthiotransferase RimO [Syntrophomonadaceae bacterium]
MDIGFISLGCAKNQVDTEIMMAILKENGHKIVNTVERSDLVIINTCGFINDAKEEAIDTIIEMGQLKEQGVIDYIIATGCLSQRYAKELMAEMPELDAVVGIGDYHSIGQVVEQVVKGDKIVLVNKPPEVFIEKGPRILSTPKGLAYLKITEGCNNKCTYCAIPLIRGKLRSNSLESLIDEARFLVKAGVKELVLIGQDTASYGQDIGYEQGLSNLLERLVEIPDLEWIRVMYIHPAHLTADIIKIMAKEDKIIPYIDLPIQHSSSSILKSMNRKHSVEDLSLIIHNLRENIKDLVLRTTVMVGFPGEREADFMELYDFVEKIAFDWLGVFKFTAEKGTPAYLLPNQLDEDIKEERLNKILKLQKEITRQKNINRINSKQKILVSSRIAPNLYIGRGYFQAPEVDGVTMIKSNCALEPGAFAEVTLKAVRNYDMIGEFDSESP